jgi:PBP1b-binding outer membrane lipoprotein LpoB
MNRKASLIVLTILLMLIVGCGEKDTQPPRVVSTIPVNESADVDSSIIGQNGKSLRTGPRVQSGFASISVTQIRE